MVARLHPTSEESTGNSLEDVSPNSNIVTNLSFAHVACTSNRSELSNDDDRGESHEEIEVEDDNNIQISTVHYSSEESNVNDFNEQQINSTLKRTYFLAREV